MIAAIIICPWYSNVACRKILHLWKIFLARNIHLHWISQMFPLIFRTKKNVFDVSMSPSQGMFSDAADARTRSPPSTSSLHQIAPETGRQRSSAMQQEPTLWS